jgi:multiple sugar transport system ATP-binding protein
MAMVFQSYALYPHMTTRENMAFGLKMATDLPKGEITSRVEETASMLGISELLDKKPDELSGGQQQRVALGRAIVREPEVFLMDEPLSNLDAKLRTQMRTELQALQQDLGVTTLYVTHDQTEAMTMGDRVAVLNDGRLQQVDKPQELYDYPENQFVAEFIGEPAMNILSVDVREHQSGGGYDAVHDGFTFQLPDGTGLAAVSGSTASFGVRPEDISLATNRPDATDTFQAEISVREPLGELLLLHCRVGNDELHVKVEPRSEIQPGDTVELAFDEKWIHLFDHDSGEAVYHSTPRTPSPEARVTE